MPFDKSHPIFELSDRLVDEICDLFPDEATYLGIKGFDHRWPDLSPDGAATAEASLRDMLARVESVPPATNHWEQLAIDVARDDLLRLIDKYESDDHFFELNSISSPIQGLKELLDYSPKADVEAWSNIATRLETFEDVFAGYRTTLEEGRSIGRMVPVRQVDEAARQAEFASGERSGLLLLLGEFDKTDIADPALRRRLVDAIDAGRRAYGAMAAYLRDVYAPDAPADDAAGAERYRRAARRMLGTELDPVEAYAWGWGEVAALRTRMEAVAEEIAPGIGFEGALEVLKTDPERLAASPDDLVAFLQQRVDQALDQLAGSHFDVPDEIRRCDVKLAPEGGPISAYYVGPSEDFSRPGSVWWSIERDKPQPLYDNVSTAYHEGFPGHHLQVGIQVGLQEHLSRYHRMMVWMPGTGEGWALYAERIMDELGYLDKPDYVFGFLAGQMLRACRVVVDIGSHLRLAIPDDQPFHPGEAWTFDTAVEMLRTYATLDEASALSEVNRYLGWPGQAIAYKLGERAIIDVRRRIEEREGDDFDLRGFHGRLLEVGPVGLDLMRSFVLDTA